MMPTPILLIALALVGANKAPEVKNAEFDTNEDQPLAAKIEANDDDGDSLQYRLAKPPKNGTATVELNGKLAYTPKTNWHGTDSLVFEVTDGKSKLSHKATINVSSVNDPPVPNVATVEV